jgi:hypothetical protein
MTDNGKARLLLAASAYAQVVFVAANTVFIAHYQLLPNLLTGFLISLVWTLNVKRVAFGDWPDRLIYATGAALGSVSGTIAAGWLLGWLA